MIYFFHHYELPVIIQQAQVQQILRRTRQRHQQQNGAHGGANAASNLRNGTNASNQANNDAMGNNQANNNGNNPNNNNQRNGNLFTNISFILNFQMATAIFNHALNAFGALQGRLTNDVFGTAAFFNNNNDNSLNNNNNNPTANITRLHINLSRLRRINLAGIQINPAEGTENVRYDINEMGNGDVGGRGGSGGGVDVIGDDDGGGEISGGGNSSENSGRVSIENSTIETSASHGNANIHIDTQTGHDDSDFAIQNQYEDSIKTNENIESHFDSVAADDFDIIDANDEIEIKPINRAAVAENSPNIGFNKTHIVSQTAKTPFEMTNDMPFYNSDNENKDTSLGYDIQIHKIDHSSSNNKFDPFNTTISNLRNQLPNDAQRIANEVRNIENDDLQQLQPPSELQRYSSNSEHQAEINSQKSNFLEGFSNENHSSIQGDRGDFSLMKTNFGICTETGESSTISSSEKASQNEPPASASSDSS